MSGGLAGGDNMTLVPLAVTRCSPIPRTHPAELGLGAGWMDEGAGRHTPLVVLFADLGMHETFYSCTIFTNMEGVRVTGSVPDVPRSLAADLCRLYRWNHI